MNHNQYIEMGYRIKNRRKELHIRQNDLAGVLGISNNHMSSIETGRQKPSMDTFLLLCEALKVTPDYLLLGSMRANNIPQDILDMLHLCSPDDVQLTHKFIELLVERNQTLWNQHNFI